MSHTKLLRPRAGKENYLHVFALGFVILLVVLLPIMIFNHGYFIYYGDFNSQQMPFYYHSHEMIRTEGVGWDWQTDLGANFIGSYSFYLLGSPFFWLTIPFPASVVPYLMPWLLCLKHATATLTAYIFLRRFVRTRQAACIGALLYAFSGFQLYNIFFNHFQDVTAFFPLLLIALEERVNNNRRGVFALAVALMATLNYFFFTGQVVFVLFYFGFRCLSKDFPITLRKFLGIALESVLGVLLSAGMLLPSALAVLGNNRLDERLEGLNMLLYSDKTRIWRIIQTFFMTPDVPARPNLFSSDNAKWASIGGYLPLFSMVGVIAFWKTRKKHWATRLTLLCGLCAMVPILNSMFYTFNASYYARWFYMPVLILALMTAVALDDPKVSLRPGITVTGGMLVLFLLFSLVPRTGEDVSGYESVANYPWYFYLTWLLCAASLGYVVILWHRKRRSVPFLNRALGMTALVSVLCTIAVVGFGVSLGPYPHTYREAGIEGADKIDLPPSENQFYRIDISEDYDNYPMFWGYSNMRCFQSVVPASIMNFYPTVGVTRDVASRADKTHYTLRGLFSVEYYLEREDDFQTGKSKLPGFTFTEIQNGFRVYHNDNYIPMGFPFKTYISETELESSSAANKERVLINALVLTDEQVEKYKDYITPVASSDAYGLTEEDYLAACKKHALNACDSFQYDSEGFTATISLDSPQLVFFSVPFEKGWSASVNGKPVDIEQVDYGMMAVLAEDGDNEIVFTYQTPGLKTGLLCSAVGGVLIVLYLIYGKKRKQKEDKLCPPVSHYYDYEAGALPIHNAYTAQVLRKAAANDKKEEPTDASGGENGKQ